MSCDCLWDPSFSLSSSSLAVVVVIVVCMVSFPLLFPTGNDRLIVLKTVFAFLRLSFFASSNSPEMRRVRLFVVVWNDFSLPALSIEPVALRLSGVGQVAATDVWLVVVASSLVAPSCCDMILTSTLLKRTRSTSSKGFQKQFKPQEIACRGRFCGSLSVLCCEDEGLGMCNIESSWLLVKINKIYDDFVGCAPIGLVLFCHDANQASPHFAHCGDLQNKQRRDRMSVALPTEKLYDTRLLENWTQNGNLWVALDIFQLSTR
jgi:hypothetical protein